MSSFEIAMKYVLDNEKELSENPKDRGGITKFGISLRFLKNIDSEKLKQYGIFHDPDEQIIRDLSQDQVIKIYHSEFWINAPFDRIKDQNMCNYVFDMAINMGIAPAIKCVQRACWAVYKDRSFIEEDGILGDITLKAINENSIISSSVRSERAGDYRVIVANHPDQKEFINGWLNRAYES